MLPDNEPPHRWPDDRASKDFNSWNDTDKSSVRHLSLADALKHAEFAARLPDVTPPALESPSTKIVPFQLDSAIDAANAGLRLEAPVHSKTVRRKQATLFLAGIGTVALGKFAIVVALSPVFSSTPTAQHGQPSIGNAIRGSSERPAALAITEAEATLQRFAFTSGKAFSDATAAFASPGEVSLAEP